MEYDFENEKESNIIPNNNDDEITSDFDNNSNLNDFEFEEVPDNYIEDKIYNNLKLKVKEFFKKEKCSYRSSNQPKVSESNRKVVRFNYCYNNDLSICRAIYKNLIGASHKYLDTIIQHLREYGIEERIHENTGRAPKNMNRIKVNYDIACDVFSFLKNYSNVHVYCDYIQAYKKKHEPGIRVISESTFVKIWKSLIPSLQFMFSKSDLCENYGKKNPNPSGSQTLYKTFKGSAHIVYDWTQNVQIPYSPQQIGSLFFKSPQKTNYIIDEGEMPDNRKQEKGHYLDGKGFQYYDFKKHFQRFKKLPNIQKYYHFYFSSQKPRIIFYKDRLEDTNYEKATVHTFSYAINILPPIID
ncbi:hypothetical protein GLOIN_2v1769618 [Rhizophagus clarus]|uniref:Uncharacterized protein n=1 Tax=Rhizophagus clarus TaxID=94130 RepID=A0A8H3R165_9GLOM|nr:hypothetical protein GLOIN_2v1769618 [Rhizophagus clarus]